MKEIVSHNSSIYSRHLIGRARHLMLLAREKELSPYHISPRQYTIMFILYNLGRRATLAELARYSYREVSSISTQLTRMRKNGLVEKFRETPQSVRLKFELTQKGIDCYKKTNKMRSIKEIMSVLSEEEHQQLISLLKKIIDKAENLQKV